MFVHSGVEFSDPKYEDGRFKKLRLAAIAIGGISVMEELEEFCGTYQEPKFWIRV